jgi:hypothetical protein
MVHKVRNNSRFNICLCLLALCALTVGCRRTDKEIAKSLEGPWALFTGNDCSNADVESDRLILRSGGVLEQHTVSNSGLHYDSIEEKWAFIPPNHVMLDARRDFFSGQSQNQFVGAKRKEVLLLELSHPKCIFLKPKSDCYYTQPK